METLPFAVGVREETTMDDNQISIFERIPTSHVEKKASLNQVTIKHVMKYHADMLHNLNCVISLP